MRKRSVPLPTVARSGSHSCLSNADSAEESHFVPRLPAKSNSLPGLPLYETPSISVLKEKVRPSPASNPSLRATVPLKAVSIGAEVLAESDHPASLSFNQYFLTTIQRKQRTADKKNPRVPQVASVNTSSLSLTQEVERKEPAFPLRRDKASTPLRMHLWTVKKGQRRLAAPGIALPSARIRPTADEKYRAKSALSHYRIRKSLQKPQVKTENTVLEQPGLKDQLLVNKLISPKADLQAKLKKGLCNVTYVQCQPYRIPIDFGLFRNVKKLFGTRLRAMFDMS